MPGVGQNIAAADYNVIQSLISPILGTGLSGYGQALQSTQVAITNIVTVAQWNALQNDIIKLNYHQLNTSPIYNSNPLTTATNVIQIRESDRSAYQQVAIGLASFSSATSGGVSYPGAYALAPVGQTTTPTVPASPVPNLGSFPVVGQRLASWGGAASGVQTVTHTVAITFPTALAAIYFFNTGSTIKLNSIFVPSQVTPKNTSWQTLLSNMGTITFGRLGTSSSNAVGTVTSYGWNYFKANLTATQIVYTNSLGTQGTSLYAPNKVEITCQLDTSGRVLTFNVLFQDLSTAAYELLADPATGLSHSQYSIDEDATGTLTSIVNVTYASGSYVSVVPYLPTPSGTGP